MIAYERGPFKLFERLRGAAGTFHFDDGSPDHDLATKEIQKLMLCVWCSSSWLAGLWLLGYVYFPGPVMIASIILAFSAGAVAMEKFING